MFSHSEIWRAIDKLAQENGLSASGLAKRAGLDPTTFNKSKRFAKDGRARWPSTESISKILTVTNESLDDFLNTAVEALPSTAPSGQRTDQNPGQLPLVGMAQAGAGGFFDDGGYPVGQGWDQVDVPDTKVEGDYALRISGDSMLPVYRNGDVIIVTMNKEAIPGDRVVVRTVDGEVMAKVLLALDEAEATLLSFNPSHPKRHVRLSDIDWMARITWASQ